MAIYYLDMAVAIILLFTALKCFPELLKNDRKVTYLQEPGFCRGSCLNDITITSHKLNHLLLVSPEREMVVSLLTH